MNYTSCQEMVLQKDWILILLVPSLSIPPRLDSSQLSSVITRLVLWNGWTGLTRALSLHGNSGVTQRMRLFLCPVLLWSRYVCQNFEVLTCSILIATSKLWYPSKDGTNIPMFVLREKSTKLDGTAPYLQYGKATISSPEHTGVIWWTVYKGMDVTMCHLFHFSAHFS